MPPTDLCKHCNGFGHFDDPADEECPVCKGTGRAPAPTAQAVKVAAGGAPPLTPEGFTAWIACSDRMPPICPNVLVWAASAEDPADGWYELAYWPGPEYGWYTDLGVKRTAADPITHWTPLPKSHPPRGAAPSPTPEGIDARLAACGWDRAVRHGDRFTLYDDGDPHGAVYLICPGGLMVPFGSCEGDIDEQRVRFIMDACNAALGAKPAQSDGAAPSPTPEGVDALTSLRALHAEACALMDHSTGGSRSLAFFQRAAVTLAVLIEAVTQAQERTPSAAGAASAPEGISDREALATEVASGVMEGRAVGLIGTDRACALHVADRIIAAGFRRP